jgi:CheY-like chemotaxis protein
MTIRTAGVSVKQAEYTEREAAPRILIVDHDRAMTSALAARLEGAGYDVTACHCSHAATKIALRRQPELIILDVDMPEFTGLEFHECLQYAGRCRDIPVIYLSANDSPTSRRVALRQGARAFLTKPYDASHLLEIVERTLDKTPADSYGTIRMSDRSVGRSDYARPRKSRDYGRFTRTALLV